MEAREEILKGAEELFMRYGIKSITMDDIARHLSVSKKTIYQFYKDKDELVLEVVKNEMNTQKCEMTIIVDSSVDVIEEMYRTSKFMRERVCRMNPTLMFDMKKYHLDAYKEFQSHKKNHIVNQIRDAIIRGVSEGFFRKDIDIEIMSRVRVEQIELAFNPEVFPSDKFQLVEVHLQMFEHFIYGISTLHGHKRLDELKHVID